MSEKYRKHKIVFYCDNILACFEYTSGPQADWIRKDSIKSFKEEFDLRQVYIVHLILESCAFSICNPKSDNW